MWRLIELLLAVATGYIVIWYIYKPTENQCTMTFMMEPPKFITIKIDSAPNREKHLTESKNKYKLYMYSEFGFPLTEDPRKDLADSMPVLFVPGNAGSYQQVRSIASTCIRLQLQSLDAYKFIYYTIDFQSQLSGISGQIIDDQINFLQRALNQIVQMHPSRTKGVILIGHSVGGFISKALFTRPNFDPDTVPLLISLSSPLTSPYLNFDSKMRQIYDQTNNFWRDNPINSKTLSISINGGRSDYLVPMHLSMDASFDLSIATSSIKDVWIPADHVSVTWCKELMHKLANLLSSLMDRSNTQLVQDRHVAISTIEEILLTRADANDQIRKDVVIKDWVINKPLMILDYDDFYTANRQQLSENVLILNLTTRTPSDDLLILVDHLKKIRARGLYCCKDIEPITSDQHVRCVQQMDLMHLSQPIPTRRFEAKKTKLLISGTELRCNYLSIDLSKHDLLSSNRLLDDLPELITIQTVNRTNYRDIRVPFIWEYLLRRLFHKYEFKITTDKTISDYFMRLRLTNLVHKTQIFKIKYQISNCMTDNGLSEVRVLSFQGQHLSEVFYAPMMSNDSQIDLKISKQESVSTFKYHATPKQYYLDLYAEGRCANSMTLEVDMFHLIISIVQRNLDKILTYATLFSYQRVVGKVLLSIYSDRVHYFTYLKFTSDTLGLILIAFVNSNNEPEEYNIDELTVLIIVLILSRGLLALIRFVIDRTIDLAIIMDRILTIGRSRLERTRTRKSESTTANGSNTRHSNPSGLDLDWPFLAIIVAASFVLSNAITNIAHLMLIIRSVIIQRKVGYADTCKLEDSLSRPDPKRKVSSIEDSSCLAKQIGSLCALALIANTPDALMRINSMEVKFEHLEFGLDQLITVVSLILLKMLHIGQCFVSENDEESAEDLSAGRMAKHEFIKEVIIYSHLFSLVSIVSIGSDLRYINWTLLTVLAWTKFSLSSSPKSA